MIGGVETRASHPDSVCLLPKCQTNQVRGHSVTCARQATILLMRHHTLCQFSKGDFFNTIRYIRQ